MVVVDNGSVDGSEQVVRAAGAEWLPTGANLGYGRAANRGAAPAPARAADYLLVCNPDLELGPGAVDALVSALAADPTLGVVGPGLWNDDGSLYPSARTFPDMVDAVGHGLLGLVAPGNRFTRRYRLLDWDHSRPAQVDWVSGACFLVRREAWDAVGGFDPAYFMYMEDVDLCWRLHRAGLGRRLRAGGPGPPRPGGLDQPAPLPHAGRPPPLHVAVRLADDRGPQTSGPPGGGGGAGRPSGGGQRSTIGLGRPAPPDGLPAAWPARQRTPARSDAGGRRGRVDL